MTLQGLPGCPLCKGSGFIYAESLFDGGRYCKCVQHQLRLLNMERIWRSLSNEKVTKEMVTKCPLKPYANQNLWVTASIPTFRKHLKAMAMHMSIEWDARVRSDADILDSWFGTAKAGGVEIFDLEIAESMLKAIDIPDLVGSYSLVILILGVKQLPNKETPNAILEAISYRTHENKPTWVVDQPDQPITSMSHKGYSDTVVNLLQQWTHLDLQGTTVRKPSDDRLIDLARPSLVSSPILTEEDISDAVSAVPEGPPTSFPVRDLLAEVSQQAKKPGKPAKSKRKK